MQIFIYLFFLNYLFIYLKEEVFQSDLRFRSGKLGGKIQMQIKFYLFHNIVILKLRKI